MAEPVIRRNLIFTGAVQGVGFRWRVRHAAEAAGVTGWVRNDYSGTVTLELQGTPAQIERVLQAIDRSPYIHVDSVDARTIPTEGDERRFSVRDDGW